MSGSTTGAHGSDRSQFRFPDPQTNQPQTGLSILIVDDSRLYREGLGAVIANEPAVGTVLMAEDAASLARVIAGECPALVLVNLASVGGLALLRGVRDAAPTAHLIAIGVLESESEIIACVEAGIAGYLLRSEPLANLMRLIRSVMAGETVCSPRVTAALMRRVAVLAAERRAAVPVLTEREEQIVDLVDRGMSNQEIAERLGIELRTVKNHVHNILSKLGVRRRGEAVAAVRMLRGNSGKSHRDRLYPAPVHSSPSPGLHV
jgi:DNA-binding NarL/FixJ family response regulator